MFDFLRKKVVRTEMGETNMNRIQAGLAWFTAEPGRKRIIGAVLLAVAQFFHFLDGFFGTLCEAAILGGAVCKLHPDAWVAYVQAVNQLVQQYIVPGADAAGVLLAGWGVLHAVSRAKDDGHSNATAIISAMTSSLPPPMPPPAPPVTVDPPVTPKV